MVSSAASVIVLCFVAVRPRAMFCNCARPSAMRVSAWNRQWWNTSIVILDAAVLAPISCIRPSTLDEAIKGLPLTTDSMTAQTRFERQRSGRCQTEVGVLLVSAWLAFSTAMIRCISRKLGLRLDSQIGTVPRISTRWRPPPVVDRTNTLCDQQGCVSASAYCSGANGKLQRTLLLRCRGLNEQIAVRAAPLSP